jgi:hypothetical protein
VKKLQKKLQKNSANFKYSGKLTLRQFGSQQVKKQQFFARRLVARQLKKRQHVARRLVARRAVAQQATIEPFLNFIGTRFLNQFQLQSLQL